MWHACDRTAASACPLLSPVSALTGCSRELILLCGTLAAAHGASLCPHCRSAHPSRAAAVCAQTNCRYLACLLPHRGISLPFNRRAAQPSRAAAVRSSYLWHACDRTAAPACPSCRRTAWPSRAQLVRPYDLCVVRLRPHCVASLLPLLPRSSASQTAAVRSSYYAARLRPHRGVGLPFAARSLALMGCSHALLLLFGLLATALRSQAADDCRAAQRQLCAFIPTTCGAFATAPRRQLTFTAAQLSPYRLRPCAHLTMARVRPHSGAHLPFMVAQPSPGRLDRALILLTWRADDAPRRAACLMLLCSSAVTGCSHVRFSRYVARLRPHRGVGPSLPPLFSALTGCSRALIWLYGTLASARLPFNHCRAASLSCERQPCAPTN